VISGDAAIPKDALGSSVCREFIPENIFVFFIKTAIATGTDACGGFSSVYRAILDRRIVIDWPLA
jgi:hypothetical protein